MKFGIVYEEYVCETVAKEKVAESNIQAAQGDMTYMESHWIRTLKNELQDVNSCISLYLKNIRENQNLHVRGGAKTLKDAQRILKMPLFNLLQLPGLI